MCMQCHHSGDIVALCNMHMPCYLKDERFVLLQTAYRGEAMIQTLTAVTQAPFLCVNMFIL